MLVREGEQRRAVDTLEELSDLLRRALQDVELQEVPLREELDFLARYLRIQQLRFGEMLAWSSAWRGRSGGACPVY